MRSDKAPTRTCIACRRREPAAALLRYRRRPDGHVTVDVHPRVTGPRQGRRAYVCPSRACLDLAVKRGAFSRALSKTGAGRSARTVLAPEAGALWKATVDAVDARLLVLQRTWNSPNPRVRLAAVEQLHQRLHQPGRSD